MISRSRLPTTLLLLALVAGGLWFAFGRSHVDGAQAELPVPVRAAPVLRRDVPLEVQAVGLVQPKETVAVRPRIDGQIVGVHFKDGDRVAAGQVLFTLDPRALKAQLAQAEALLVKDRAALTQSKGDIARYAELARGRVVSEQKYEQTKAATDAAAAAVAADEAQVENLRVQLGYTEIRAPIAGRAGTINLTQGAVVKAADATALVTINLIQPVRVQLSLPQRHLVSLREALARGSVEVVAARQEASDRPVTGAVEFVDNTIDPQTGAFVLKALFANDDEILWPGMFVNCRVRLKTEGDAVTVPSASVRSNQQGQYVFLVQPDGRVRLTQVKVARVHGDLSVIEQGVEPGQTVVIEGQLRLAEGTRVEIRPDTARDNGTPSHTRS